MLSQQESQPYATIEDERSNIEQPSEVLKLLPIWVGDGRYKQTGHTTASTRQTGKARERSMKRDKAYRSASRSMHNGQQAWKLHLRSGHPGHELGDIVVIEAFDDPAALWRRRAQLRELLGDPPDGRRGEGHRGGGD